MHSCSCAILGFDCPKVQNALAEVQHNSFLINWLPPLFLLDDFSDLFSVHRKNHRTAPSRFPFVLFIALQEKEGGWLLRVPLDSVTWYGAGEGGCLSKLSAQGGVVHNGFGSTYVSDIILGHRYCAFYRDLMLSPILKLLTSVVLSLVLHMTSRTAALLPESLARFTGITSELFLLSPFNLTDFAYILCHCDRQQYCFSSTWHQLKNFS